jgi:hypothetical protein
MLNQPAWQRTPNSKPPNKEIYYSMRPYNKIVDNYLSNVDQIIENIFELYG